MRILILGGTRFIGPHVVHRLIEWGHSVTIFHRGLNQAQFPPSVRSILGDRRELDGHRLEFERLAPDVVLDMYAMCEQDALDSTRVLSGIAGRFVVVSSMDVYRAYGVLLGLEDGPPDPLPLVEDSPLRTRLYPYHGADTIPLDRTEEYDKIPVEQVVLTRPDLPGTVVRLPMVYGPGDFRHRLYPFLQRMDRGRPTIVLPESVARWQGVWGYVENVALAIALAVSEERATGRVYHVAEAEPVDELERLSRLAMVAGWPGRFVVIPNTQVPSWSPPLNLAQRWVADSARIRRELGYAEAVDTQEALRRTMIWERASPPTDSESRTSEFLLDETLEDKWLAV